MSAPAAQRSASICSRVVAGLPASLGLPAGGTSDPQPAPDAAVAPILAFTLAPPTLAPPTLAPPSGGSQGGRSQGCGAVFRRLSVMETEQNEG